MPSKSLTDQLLPSLAAWELTDLRELYSALGGLIEALETPQKTPELGAGDGNSKEEATQQRSQQGSRGHIEVKSIPRGNKRHGPYLYLRY